LNNERRDEALRTAGARIGKTIDGKYKIKAVLGVGGMGVVYEAQHLFLDRMVALKVLHPRYEDARDAEARFLREARVLGRLRNRAIVQVLDGGFVDGATPYIVMERLRGENLAQRIQRRQKLRLEQGVVILRELLKGLSAAHEKGIVHCDLKPENVFLTQGMIAPRHVKILDFGIARIARTEAASIRDGVMRVYGTPEYMAPEQITHGEVDARTDLYSTGILIWEALTGRHAYGAPGDDRKTIMKKVLKDSIPKMTGTREPVPAPIAKLIERLMAKNKQDRPSSADEVMAVLDAIPPASLGAVPRLPVDDPDDE
jgi:serine/threonine-protein kinase